MDKSEFLNILKEKSLVLNASQIEQLDTYAAFLKEYNEKINLTAITVYEEVLEKHFLDSLYASFHKAITGTLVDVGTGAGFPGVVLKICYPELKVILLEPIGKRCTFLKELIAKLKLKDIEVINTRGEDYANKHREAYDFVTARAVTNLNALIEVCGALVKKDGYFIALRGLEGEEEIKNASKAIKEMSFEIEDTYIETLGEAKRVISYFKKVKPTAKKYPRQYSIIKSHPL